MAGFMNWRIPLVVRRALTMVPSLIVLGLSVNTTEALVYSQVVLSFGIPFALLPLLVVTRDRRLMHEMSNRRCYVRGDDRGDVVITALNLDLLVGTIGSAV